MSGTAPAPAAPREEAALAERRRTLARLEREVAVREAEIAKLAAELGPERAAGRSTAVVERPRRPPLRSLLKSILGMRLQLEPYHPPRPLRVPRRYNHSRPRAATPSVSIVTPSFNQRGFLEHTLLSVIEQGYPRLEYVVQDGGSRDGSEEVLERFRPRLHHVESRADGGLAHALNLGFARTSGEVMAYLNSDDLLLPGTLDYVARYFDEHPEVEVIYGHRVLIDAQGLEIGRWILPPHRNDQLLFADYVPQETLFWRRGIWDRAGGRVDESFQFAVDWELLLRFIDAGARMVRVPRFLGAFRVHSQQKTALQLNGLGAREMDRVRQRYHGRGLSHAEVRRGLIRFMVLHACCRRLYQAGLFRY